MDNLRSLPTLGLLLRLVTQQWGADVDATLREAGFDDIRAPHANVFPFVTSKGIQASRLARLARVRKQTMLQTLAELERAGYVERRPDPDDRRGRLVYLTPRGEAVRAVGAQTARRVEQRWAELTSPREVEALRAALERLLDRLDERPATAVWNRALSRPPARPALPPPGRLAQGDAEPPTSTS